MTLTLLPWTLLFPAYALLWWPAVRVYGLGLLAVGLGLAAWQHQLGWAALAPMALLAVSGWLVHRRYWVGHLLFIVLALGLGMHILPGFHNPLVIDTSGIKPGSIPWRMYLNLDKPLVAWWVLLVVAPPLARGLQVSLRAALQAGLGASAVCLGLAWILGQIHWAPGWPVQSLIWMLNNALLVTLAEEAFFRGYVQQQLTPRIGPRLACVLAALLFGLAHASGGPFMVVLASLAGLAYGWAYQRGGLSAAVLAHLLLNSVHFWFFSYPMAAWPT